MFFDRFVEVICLRLYPSLLLSLLVEADTLQASEKAEVVAPDKMSDRTSVSQLLVFEATNRSAEAQSKEGKAVACNSRCMVQLLTNRKEETPTCLTTHHHRS